jgi:hypothetical protein
MAKLVTVQDMVTGKSVDLVAENRDEKRPFSSGKFGYYAGGKIVMDGKRYQVSMSIVEITPKDTVAS